MKLSTIFQISLYGLAGVSNLVLAMAEGNALSPQSIAIPLLLIAFFFNEQWKTLVLSNLWTNILGLAAFAAAVYEFYDGNLESQVLSFAHLVVYLMVAIAFGAKTLRHYWWMIAMSVLQMAVASLLTSDGWFGVALIGYMVLAIWTLSVLSLSEAESRYALPGTTGPVAGAPQSLMDAPVRFAAVAAPAGGAVPQIRYFFRQQSRTRGTMRHDPRQKWINSQFVSGVAATTLLAIAVGVLFFIFVPRLWIGKRAPLSDDLDTPLSRSTGFTETVQLGEIGQILASTERVLQVKLFDNDTNKPIDIENYVQALGADEPLFRGNVMGHYERGRWSVGFGQSDYQDAKFPDHLPDKLVRQEYVLAPVGSSILFAVHPVRWFKLRNTDHAVEFADRTNVYRRPHAIAATKTLAYDVYCEHPGSAAANFSGRPAETRTSRVYRQLPENLGRLRALARIQSGIDAQQPPTMADMAFRLERFLRDNPQFNYSLDAAVDNPAVDPVEDFLFNRKQGHCEYFASALALMLREVDIPSRLVSGFKGGEPNRFTNDFIVQQCHAHAWVEAFIDGRWIVLDPTPADRQASVEDIGTSRPPWKDFLDMASSFWDQNIVRLSLSDQQLRLYEPLRRRIATVLVWVGDLLRGIGLDPDELRIWLQSPERWLSWQGGVAALGLLALLYGSTWAVRKLRRRFRFRRRLKRALRNGRCVRVDFYERFQKALSQHGIVRELAQTQREFAARFERDRAELLDSSGLRQRSLNLVDLFYRVRFGSEDLSPQEREQIDGLLTRLETCLAATNGNGQGAGPGHSRGPAISS